MNVRVDVPDEILDEIVERVTERVRAELAESLADVARSESSPYMTIPEAAAYLRCGRQRIDDLLSQRRLARIKDGSRTLVLRSEIEQHLHHDKRRRP